MKGYDVLTIFAYMMLYVHLFPHVSKIFVCLDLITSHHEKHPVLCRIDSQLIIKMLFMRSKKLQSFGLKKKKNLSWWPPSIFLLLLWINKSERKMSKVDSLLRIWKNFQLVKQDSLSSNISYTVSAVLKFKFGECADLDTEKFELFFLVLCNQLLAVLLITAMIVRAQKRRRLLYSWRRHVRCRGNVLGWDTAQRN